MTAAPLGDNCSQLREKQDITEPSGNYDLTQYLESGAVVADRA